MRQVTGGLTGLLCVLLFSGRVHSQWILSGQLRTRTELRNGAGSLQTKGERNAFFTSQRTRLTVQYKMDHVHFLATVQDVRVWGQDASTISILDGNKAGFHEAWAEIILADRKDSTFTNPALDYLSVKIGRQELSYDDQRLMGALDWMQQGRRHDAIVFKLLNKGWQADLGAAFNQNTDVFNDNGTFYTPANVLPYVKDSKGNLAPTPAYFIPLTNAAGRSARDGSPAIQAQPSTNGLYQDYKEMQYIYAARTFNKTKISGLVLADEFGKYAMIRS